MDGRILTGGIILLLMVLAGMGIWIYRIKGQLLILQRQAEVLREISDEILYEYHLDSKNLIPIGKCSHLLGEGEDYRRAAGALINSFVFHNDTCQTTEVWIPLAEGRKQRFKSINSSILNRHGNLDRIIGKLIPAEKEGQAI